MYYLERMLMTPLHPVIQDEYYPDQVTQHGQDNDYFNFSEVILQELRGAHGEKPDVLVDLPLPALDVVTPEAADPTPGYVITPRSTTIDGLALADSVPLYLRWTTDDVSGSGSRDEIGIDNVVVTATEVPVELMRFEIE